MIRAPRQRTVSICAGHSPVAKGNAFIYPDIIVIMVVPYKCSHHILHIDKRGEHTRVYAGGSHSALPTVTIGFSVAGQLIILKQRYVEESQCRYRFLPFRSV